MVGGSRSPVARLGRVWSGSVGVSVSRISSSEVSLVREPFALHLKRSTHPASEAARSVGRGFATGCDVLGPTVGSQMRSSSGLSLYRTDRA